MKQKQIFKKIVATALSIGIVLSSNILPVWSNSDDQGKLNKDGNLLVNPSFENMRQGWEFLNSSGAPGVGGTGSGIQNIITHSGQYGFFLSKGARYGVQQTVTVPYSGYYSTSGFLNTNGDTAVFGVRYANGDTITEITLPTDLTMQEDSKTAAVKALPDIELKQGDKVQIYINGGDTTDSLNGDDISFKYKISDVNYNLMKSMDFSENKTQKICVPRSGDYLFSADVTAETKVTISCGEMQKQVSAGDTTQVTFAIKNCVQDQELKFEMQGTGTVTNTSLAYDTSTAPNSSIEVQDVKIDGIAETGKAIKGSYTFKSSEDDSVEGDSKLCWLMSDKLDGSYVKIEDQRTDGFILTDDLDGKYLKFQVTPIDNYGISGETVTSDTFGPVNINWIRNSGLEKESNSISIGWTGKNGGNRPNNKANARKGFIYAEIPANNKEAEMFYEFTAERTGYYNAGAWVNLKDGESSLVVRNGITGQVIKSKTITSSDSGYRFVSMDNVPIEKGTTVQSAICGNTGSNALYADDFQMIIANKEIPEFTNLFKFEVEEQEGKSIIDSEKKTINITVPYGTDCSKLTVNAVISDGAEINPKSGTVVDFSNGSVEFKITNGNLSDTWTVIVKAADKKVHLVSDNKTLEEAFNWAVDKTQQFVMTGKSGLVNKDETNPSGTGTADYMPSYWAGYCDRTAFYARDFCHQSTGATLVGLTEENYHMFNAFAKTSNESRKWYALWSLNFDGTPHKIDYRDDSYFVREVPSEFELVEYCYKQYLWTGDERYINDEMFNFYTNTMTKFIEAHDTNNNGVAEGTGKSIYDGVASYNERGGQPLLEAGDSIGSQYQATLAYAGFLQARGDKEGAKEWNKKADDLKTYFNEEWSVINGDKDGRYARGIAIDNKTKHNDFGKENSWFMPLKMITEPGQRTNEYLDYITENMAEGIGTGPNAPNNIEAYTYIPDMFFRFNRNDDAWKWMKYILSIRDNPHERPEQGTNGDFPEISFTVISQVVEGMMGVTPNAHLNQLTTIPRLPSEVNEVTLEYQEIGNNEVNLTHQGNTKSILENTKGEDLIWEAQFYGEYPCILVDGAYLPAQTKDINGETVSYVTVTVKSGKSVAAQPSTPPTEKLRTAILEYVIELAEQAKADRALEGVVETVRTEFNNALTNGKTILADAKSTNPTVNQEDIDNAQLRIIKVMQYLEFKGDKTQLNILLNMAAKFEANKKLYIPSTYIGFEKALETARKTAADGDALNDEIVPVCTNLLTAMANLRIIPNKENLGRLKAKAEAVDSNLYTAESIAVLNTALARANDILNDQEADQEAVEAAETALSQALAGLTAITAGNNGNVEAVGTNSAGNINNTKTGDNLPISIAFSLLVLSGLAVLALKTRKNEN